MNVNEHIRLRLVHEIHTSERRSFRGCRRRWDWIFRQNYYPQMTPKPLEFGSAFHVAMEKYYDPDKWTWDREVVGNLSIKAFVDKCEEQRQRSLQYTGDTYLEDDVQKDYDERLELGRGMLKYYFKEVAPVLDKGWKPVKVEVEFMLPIPNPETGDPIIWCKCSQCYQRWSDYVKSYPMGSPETEWIATASGDFFGLPVVYAGRIDMLAESAADGSYWIFDWKTARSISEQYEFLYLDDQILSYVWALRKLGLPVRGFVYHEQRKAYPKPPEMNKVRRLGRIYSVNKNQETDYDSYLKAVQENDTAAYEAGYYNEFLEFLKNEGTVFYSRHQIYKSDAEIAEAEKNIGYEALDMTDPGIRIYPASGRFGCSFCAFQEPCKEKNAQGDFQFVLDSLFEKRQHYYLREESTTESTGAQ